ncbi:MAG: nucleotidyltransferase family protein [Clostridiales bacterium]|jgi:predicted nucleotidyltransferase|nr:nucleotidyltransferase family protein [Clostridiales bacterium]
MNLKTMLEPAAAAERSADAVGVVAEYNPFHNGHAYHLSRAKEITGCENAIVIMSGNFTQRGEPAIADKSARARMALLNGADLVLELPVWFATASAEYFAGAAVRLLQATGITRSICFGAETAEPESLRRAARLMAEEPRDFKAYLRTGLASGATYARAYAEALRACGCPEFRKPNDILALEYVKAIEKLGGTLTPYVVKRTSDYWDRFRHGADTSKGTWSASAARSALRAGEFEALKKIIPGTCSGQSAFEILMADTNNGTCLAELNRLSEIFKYILLMRGREWAKGIMDIGEGLENRLLRSAGQASALEDIITAAGTRRYTRTRITRAALHLILEMTRAEFEGFTSQGGPKYLRVLGFRTDKAPLLREIERRGELPLITNLKAAARILDADAMRMLQKEIVSADIYRLTRGELNWASEIVREIVKV